MATAQIILYFISAFKNPVYDAARSLRSLRSNYSLSISIVNYITIIP